MISNPEQTYQTTLCCGPGKRWSHYPGLWHAFISNVDESVKKNSFCLRNSSISDVLMFLGPPGAQTKLLETCTRNLMISVIP